MKLIPNWLRAQRPTPEAKVSAAGRTLALWSLGLPVWTPRDYENFAREAYSVNAVAYRCVKIIASNCASVPLCLYSGKKEIEEHPLLSLLARPNPMASGAFFFEAVTAFLMLAGNSYIEGVGPDGKPPRELWFLRPDRMKVIPGASGMPMGYEHIASGTPTRWEADQLTGASPILHLKEFNPLDDWYGMSRVEAAAYGIDRHNAASKHNKALLDNGGRPMGALVFKPVNSLDGPMSAPQEVLDAAEARLTERHAGAINAGRSLVLSGDVDWKEMGTNPRDMDFAAGKDDSAWDICVAMGVPPILVVKGQQSYNNITEAKLELFEETVLPVLDLILDGLNGWLAPAFGDNLKLKPDLDSVSALEKRREIKRKTAIDLMDRGVIDDTEAREMLDYGPRDPASVKKVDSGVITALLGAVNTVGIAPLVRYMRSVGLFDANATEAEIIAAAMAYAEETAPDDPNPQDEPPPDQQPPGEGAEEDANSDAQQV